MAFEPKSIGGIKAELREQQETLGIPVPVLKSMGKEISKSAKKNVNDTIPLARLYGMNMGARAASLPPLRSEQWSWSSPRGSSFC